MKAPYWFEKEGKSYRLYEKGRRTTKTFNTIESAKKSVLAMNDEFRASHGKMALPRVKNPGKKAAAKLRPLSPRQSSRVHEGVDLEHYLEMNERYMAPDEVARIKARIAKIERLQRNPRRRR